MSNSAESSNRGYGSNKKVVYPTIIPSALEYFEEIKAASTGREITLFLDDDGTLSPIVADPSQVFMSNEMRSAVRNLSKFHRVAIVSGRDRVKVYNFVKLDELCYAGSHGMDIQYNNGGEDILFQPEDAQEYPSIMNEVCEVLLERTKSIDGVLLENHTFCMSVHYRRVDKKKWDELKEIVVDKNPKLRLACGKKVFEVRPAIKWDKGDAVNFLLKSLGYANSDEVFPIYIGDEDAFRVLNERGQGIGILVSREATETGASYQLQDPF